MILKFLTLQTQPADLSQTVGQLTQSSIELAEATANLGALKVIFGVFLVFMLLVLVLFIYQILAMSSKINKIQDASEVVQQFFERASDRALGKSQCDILIRRSFVGLSNALKYQILRIRLENHIELKDITKSKVESIVKNEFDTLRTFLSNYRYQGEALNKVVQSADVELIIHFMLEQVYTPKDLFTISGMDQAVTLFLEGIKLDYISKI